MNVITFNIDETTVQINRFYREQFMLMVQWPSIKLYGIGDIEYVSQQLSFDDVRKAYQKAFGDLSSVYRSLHLLDSGEQFCQSRPTEDYVLGYEGDLNAVPEAEESFMSLVLSGKFFMTPKEFLIAAFRRRLETGDILDQSCGTILAQTDSRAYAVTTKNPETSQFAGKSRWFVTNESTEELGFRKIKIYTE
jgi:hypothetical protein